MQSTIRTVVLSAAAATLCALTATLAVLAVSRPSILVASPSASSTTSTFDPGVITSGDAIVSRKPDLALISAAVESKQSSASAAQSDLAGKAAGLIARAKALGIADKDINTSGYSVGPSYAPNTGTIDGYRAFEGLVLKWHNVDTVGKTLDALVQEGGATQISVGFTLADPKAAQAEARSLAIGKVLRVSDLSSSGYASANFDIKGGAAASTQVPVGQLDVQVAVEVDFAIDG
jgi:uncharacterized protein YggE